MIKNDIWIREQAEAGMIAPFEPSLVRRVQGDFCGLDGEGCDRPVISYGTSSAGYDVRLSPKEFKIFRHIPGTIVNPKRFNSENLESVELHSCADGDYFVIPAHSYALCTTIERISMPMNATGLLLNKSTLVRCGVVLPATVIEVGWVGHITIEISNSSAADVMLFASEGIAQLLFFEGDPSAVDYKKRSGKYMDQPEAIVIAKV